MDSTTSIILTVIITCGFTILSIVITLWWSHKETLKPLGRIDYSMKKNHEDAMAIMNRIDASIKKNHEDAMMVMKKNHEDAMMVMKKNHEDAMAIMGRVECLLEKMHLTLEKVHDGNIANAKMQGCDVLCDVERKEDAEKYGKVIHYGKETKLAWVRPKQTS